MKDYATVSRYLTDDKLRTLPIACRHVPLDQWLITHVDTSWKVNDVKLWILSKCNAWGTSNGPQPPRFRPASPVTFSTPSRRSSLDSTSWAGTEEGDDDDWENFASSSLDYARDSLGADASGKDSGTQTFYHTQRPAAAVAPEHAQTSAKYTLFSFSSGYILEDEADLSWYRPRAFEMLELHRAGAIVPLPRASPAYLEPYFESPVHVSDRPHGRRTRVRAVGINASMGGGDDVAQPAQGQTVEWKPRWAILRSGVLHLCKDSNAPPSHKFPVSSLLELSGPEKLGLVVKSPSHIICAKFRRSPATSRLNPDDMQDRRRHKVSKTSSWVMLDLLNQSAYESLLRILHRSAPNSLLSSFVPAIITPKTPVPSPAVSSPNSPISFHSSSSFPPDPLLAPFGVQYPEWRVALCARARNAGLGDIGPAMAHYLVSGPGAAMPNSHLNNFFHHLPRAPSISEGLRREAAAAQMPPSSSDGSSSVSTPKVLGSWGDELNDEEDMESEVEWDGWVRDLVRRAEQPPMPMQKMQAPDFAGLGMGSPLPHRTVVSSPTHLPSSPASSSEYGHGGTDSSYDGSTSPRMRTLSYSPHPHSASPASGIPSSASMHLQRSRSSTVSASTVTGHTHAHLHHSHSAYGDAPSSGNAEMLSSASASTTGMSSSPPLPYGFMSTTTTTTTITTYVERVPEPHADPHPAWHQQLRDGLAAAAGPGIGYVHAPVAMSIPVTASASATAVMVGRGQGCATPPSSFSRSTSFVASVSPTRSNGQGHGYGNGNAQTSVPSESVAVSASPPVSATGPAFDAGASTSFSGPGGNGVSGSGSTSGNSNGSGGGLGIGNVRRIVRGVSIRNVLSPERFVRGFEDALDFVDGR